MSERCAASRHVELIAATLARGETYSMIEDDPPAIAESLQAVVQSLWKARADNARLREALRRIVEHCANDGLPNEMVAERVIDRVDEEARAALKERGDE